MLRTVPLLILAALLAGCKAVVLSPSGDIAIQQRDLIYISVALMLIIIIPVMILTVWFAWRYRESNTEATYKPDWDHSTKIELVVWAVPLLIIIALGAITWVSAADAVPAEIRLYDRLFTDAMPDAGDKNFLDYINPDSFKVVQGWLEAGAKAAPGTAWQFERLGYFVADRVESTEERPVINRAATLRDTWN